MRIGVLSDIHGNIDALQAVLRECNQYKIDHYFFLGDYVGYYYNPHKVWKLILSLNGTLIKGNHENILFEISNQSISKKEIKDKYGIAHEMALGQFSKNEIKSIFDLPEKLTITYNNTSFQLNHGSPWNQDTYLYHNTDANILDQADDPEIDYVLVGHSHYSFIKKLDNSILINPGSVGQNREKGGIASWAFIDLEKNVHEIIQTPYSVEKLAKEVKINDPSIEYNHKILFRE